MNPTSPYSPLKIYWHQDRLEAIRRGEVPPPVQVQLIISDLCNQDCGFCAYRTSGYSSNEMFGVTREDGSVNNNPPRRIPFEKVVEILEDAAAMGVKAVQITGGGEPTVHPQFNAIIQRCLDLGLELGLVTNGVRLNAEAADILMQAAWVRVSVDAGSKETYCALRRVPESHFWSAWNNIRQLTERKRVTGSKVTIGVGFVITKENWHEVLTAAWLARESSVDSFRISAVFQPQDAGYFTEFLSEAQHFAATAEAFSTESFQVVNMFGDRVGDLEQRHPGYEFCGIQHLTTYIGADLNVYRCCVLAYNRRGQIGSLKDQTFAELWAKDAPKAFKGFNARECPRCQFNNKNAEIARALVPPQHVNFV